MKMTLNILALSGGKIEENGMLYANAIYLDEGINKSITDDRIDYGQKHAKIRMTTENNNQMIKDLAQSGLVPGQIEFTVETKVKQGEMSLVLTSFNQNAKAA
jgi:hypothetical protein